METPQKSSALYYGKDEIVSQAKNLQGDTIVTLADEKQIVIHRDVVERVITPEPITDLAELRRRRVEPVVQKVLDLCKEYNLLPFSPMNEVKFLLDLVVSSMDMNLQNAYAKLWKKPEAEVTMQDVIHTLSS